MKFGIKYQQLKKNPLFEEYLPHCQFLHYVELKHQLKSIRDDPTKENKQQFQDKLQEFVNMVEAYILKILQETDIYEEQEQGYIKHIKTYTALKEYSVINQEAVRKISKKYDKLVEEVPFLQKKLLQKMNEMEMGQRKLIQERIEKAQGEENKLLDKENFDKLKQDVDQLQKKQKDSIESEMNKNNGIQPTQMNLSIHTDHSEGDRSIQDLHDITLQHGEINVAENQQLQNLSGCQKLKQWYKQNDKLIQILIAYLVIMVIPILLAPLVNQSESDIMTILIFTIPLSFFLGAALGGNDICNSVGTCYGSDTLTMKQCIIWGIIFEVLGSVLLGGNVAKTISKGIIDPEAFTDPNLFALCMPAVLAGSAFAVCSVTIYGIPVSITQGVLFGLASVGLASVGSKGVSGGGLINVIIALLTSPLIGALLSLLLYYFIIKIIKQSNNTYGRTKQWLPILGFLNVALVMFIVLYKGMKLEPFWLVIVLSVACGVVTGIVLAVYTNIKSKKLNIEQMSKKKIEETSLDQFRPLLIISAACVAFAHGSNNVGNCVGPMLAVVNVYNRGSLALTSDPIDIPLWALFLGAASFVAGILGIGSRTIATVGNGVTSLDPQKAFTIQVGTSAAILISSIIGFPVSTSHCTIGSVIGATLAEKYSGLPYILKKDGINKMLASWIYTIPFVFTLAVYFFYSFKGVFY